MTSFYVIYKINDIDNVDEEYKEIEGTIIDINEDSITLKAKEKIKIYCKNIEGFNLGDKVKVLGTINPISKNTIFNLFNYKNYMLSKNIHYNMKTTKIEVIEKNKNIFYSMKEFIRKSVSNNPYLNTFILGDNSKIDNKALNSYRDNGISHLFAISGMHIYFLSTIILYLLNKIKKSKINYLLVIIFLLFFAFLTNFSPSVLRATFLYIFITINRLLNFNLKTYKLLIIIMCINLFINPYNIYNIGFKFSYTISMFLIVFSGIINRNKNYLVKLFMTSLIAFLASIPILINNYFNINLMTVLNNIVFVPLISLVIFPFSFIVLFVPKLNFIYEYLIRFLEFLSCFMIKFKIEIILCKTSYIITVLYYLIIILVLYKIYKRKYLYMTILIIIVLVHSNINLMKIDSFVTFIDVKQGDSVLIHNRYNILIDTGGLYNSNIYLNTINYLKSVGIKKIDYLILSHGDYDHMGEAINLVNNFKVENVIFNCGDFNDLEKELIKVLDKKKIKYHSCIKELNIDNNKLYFLQTKKYDNENDNSNVIYTELNGYKFMFMGDASSTTEKEIMGKYNLPDIDVLKVGHHGSRTSSGKEFINEVNPNYSIISVGKKNRYGHPNKEVIDNLKDSKIYRTDEDGSIMFKIKNNKLKIETCSP